MTTRTLDVLVFIPLIPVLPALVTWWLPWEKWIPRKVPNKIIGPYLLYCAFAVRHFSGPWWLVVGVALWGIVVSVMAVFEWLRTRRIQEAVHWPVTDGWVAQIGESHDDNGFPKVTLVYTYRVQDERFVGREEFAFTKDEEAACFVAGCRERALKVHYQPDKPQVSVLAREWTT